MWHFSLSTGAAKKLVARIKPVRGSLTVRPYVRTQSFSNRLAVSGCSILHEFERNFQEFMPICNEFASICMNLHQLALNLHQLTMNLHQLTMNLHQLA
jgi:hypothetical protein